MAKKDNQSASGVAFVGCMMVGLGLGVVFNNAGAGVLIGMGVGFLVMSVMRAQK